MGESIPPPLFTLRGHNVGVTALWQFSAKLITTSSDNNSTYLISGDESGTVIIWNLLTFRRTLTYSNLVKSRIQSLRSVVLKVKDNDNCDILILQSRDDGILIVDLSHGLANLDSNNEPKILASFPAYSSLFSRGDSMQLEDRQTTDKLAILAYPSCLENYLVTVRVLSSDVKTTLSGTARRSDSCENQKNSSIFDILIREYFEDNKFMLSVAYEDGHLCLFTFSLESRKTLPVLQATGLKIDQIGNFDLKIGDFVSAYDISLTFSSRQLLAICGSPLKNLVFIQDELTNDDNLSLDSPNKFDTIALKSQGVSCVKIRPDHRLSAIACWNNIVKLYSLKSRKLLANLNYHSKQVTDMLFVDKLSIDNSQSAETGDEKTMMNGRYLLCCASMEGTISVSSLY